MSKVAWMSVFVVVVIALGSQTAWAWPRACCLSDGTCIDDIMPVDCENDLGGQQFGDGTTCADVVGVEPACSPGTCRITGGGMDCANGIFKPGECKGAEGNKKRETFGGQVGAHGSEFGEWTHVHHEPGGGDSWMFHGGTNSGQGPAPNGTFMQVVACSDTPACDPAKANGLYKQIDIVGAGVFKNGTPPGGVALGVICDVTLHIEDLGEPGKGKEGKQPNDNGCLVGGHAGLEVCLETDCDCGCPDYYEIIITCNGVEVYNHSDYITTGNLQMHSSLD